MYLINKSILGQNKSEYQDILQVHIVEIYLNFLMHVKSPK